MPKYLFLVPLLVLISACAQSPPSVAPTQPPAPTQNESGPTVTPVNMPCVVLNQPSPTGTPAPTASGAQNSHSLGLGSAAVTILVFSDYQCPACRYVAEVLKQIYQTHPDDVRLIYLDYPLPGHDKAILAIQAADAADQQGKFWEMHDLLFEKQAEWSGLTPSAFPAWVVEQAAGLGLNVAQFQSDFQGQVVKALAQNAQKAVASDSANPKSLPAVYINSATPYTNSLVDFAGLDQVVSLLALTKKQYSSCPPMEVDPLKQYLATLHTAKGDIVIQLYADKAPLAVNDFVFLARSGWYNNNTFERVLPGILVQTGDPSGTGMGNPGYFIDTDIPKGLLFDRPGVVAMANTGTNTNGSQFLITLAAEPQMNGAYTIFGQVLSGMDILGQLTARDPSPDQYLSPGDALTTVTITER
ncbi:MAG: peptidylprolyl isomerase [Anaerolineales bacterium]|jgi:cyclophilin family peptidyl-prolyl cis-trans isomerase/protein-disulfide isomerase